MDKQEDWLTVHTKPGKTGIAQAQYKCQKCMDTGWILFCDENGYEMARRCSCYAVNRARELMEKSGFLKSSAKKVLAALMTWETIYWLMLKTKR